MERRGTCPLLSRSWHTLLRPLATATLPCTRVVLPPAPGQMQLEAHTITLQRHAQGATVALHEVLNNGESKPQASLCPVDGLLPLDELRLYRRIADIERAITAAG